MKAKLLALAAGILGGFITCQAMAHHSFAAEFDPDSQLKMTGVVTRMDWVNPHAFIYLEIVQENGEPQVWAFELGAINSLMRRGWTRNSLEPGTEVIITGTRARDGSLKANAQTVLLAESCERLFTGTSQTDYAETDVELEICEK